MSIILDPGLTLEMGRRSYVNGERIFNPTGLRAKISIANFSSIAPNLTIIGWDHFTHRITTYPFLNPSNRSLYPAIAELEDPVTLGIMKRGEVVIGNDVWIGQDVKLFQGVTIGDGAVIGACSLVNKSVEPYTIVAGIPARPIRKRFSDDEIAILQRLRWWDWPDERINDLMTALNGTSVAELEKAVEEDARKRAAKEAAAKELLAQANEALAEGRNAAALEASQEAIKLSPDSGEIALALGSAELNCGQYEAAIASFRRATRLMPQRASAHANLALALEHNGKTREAFQCATMALAYERGNIVAMKVRARCHLILRQFETAEEFCRKILALRPDDADAETILHGIVNNRATRLPNATCAWTGPALV